MLEKFLAATQRLPQIGEAVSITNVHHVTRLGRIDSLRADGHGRAFFVLNALNGLRTQRHILALDQTAWFSVLDEAEQDDSHFRLPGVAGLSGRWSK